MRYLSKLWGLWALLTLICLPLAARAQDTAILEVRSNVDGAIVYIDGELLGETPLSELIAPGRHTLRIERDGHDPLEQIIEVGIDGLVEIQAELIRNAPGLLIQTGVDDARVEVDGRQVGVGARVVVDPAPLGRHRIRVESPTQGSKETEVTLRSATVVTVDIPLVTPRGTLIVRSEPPGARVFLGAVDRGLTPLRLEGVEAGGGGVRLSLDGHSDVYQAVTVTAGQETALDVVLVNEGGTLEVRPSVRSAEVSLNGVPVGSGRVVLEPVRAGMYSLRVSAPGHADYVAPVRVDPEHRTVIAARLEAFGADRVASTSVPVTRRPGFWVGIGAGAAAVLGGVITAVAVSQADGPGDDPVPPVGVAPPTAAYRFALP